jgi:hypothetical protein
MNMKRLIWVLVGAAVLFVLYLMVFTPAGPLTQGPVRSGI